MTITGDEQLPGPVNFREELVYIRRSAGESSRHHSPPSFILISQCQTNQIAGLATMRTQARSRLSSLALNSSFPMAKVQSHTPNLALSRSLTAFSLSTIILPQARSCFARCD